MLTLFPDLAPNQTYRFSVSDLHDIYVEESGNRNGIPIVVMHGGPGLGCGRYLRRFFDSERFRIIMIDQRGAGRSKPLAETSGNSTEALVSDVERVRQELSVDKWLVFGYGWGAALALAYAVAHSESVVGMLLQGVMLGGQKEVDWLFKDGCNRVFPDAWEEFVAPLGAGEQGDVLRAYSARLNDSNELVQMQAAKAWAYWMARCSTLHPNQSVVDYYLNPHIAIALAKLQCHYFTNLGFRADASTFAGLKSLSGIPGVLVHGRYDLIAPLNGALALQHHWSGAEIHIIRDAGHSIAEPAIVDAILNSINQLVDRVGPDIA
ncbi:prolyl aminopeptidase [Alkalimarinus sediminis]|uniref:Proline iminopeptidase n=1 Tax=Alkalimarinus sediminis TaxID=1632866 RepID=A0A9E8KR05_9ALTE|nr:prolyl aminopeptidase [Alkalimarinus sediminis]UZW75457.1 prolyl aminopeptidase [Alkalimarinus sediminis]